MTSWYQSPKITSLDTETTGVDTDTARILQAAVVDIAPQTRPVITQWLLDPGCDVPEEVAEVHGFTRERILSIVGGEGRALRVSATGRESMPVDGALGEIAGRVAMAMHTEIPLVVANASYDLTLLEVELDRHGIDSLASRPSGVRGVVDPMVIDRAFDQYRKACYKAPGCDPETGVHECTGCRGGKFQCGGCGVHDRKLVSLCAHYGVPLTGAHDAAADALAAARLSVRLGGLWPSIGRWKLGTLHEHQVTWKRDQMDSLRAFFDGKGIEHDGCDPDWPVRRTPVASGVAS